ncbi:MAG: YggS family pyridoxal phosphate enzyme, partial [Actinomycetota bacterium]
VDAGCTSIGENYAQELATKRTVLERLGDRRPTVSFIGHLQSNKVRQLVGVVDVWATVDRSSLAAEIAKRSPEARVLLQVNVTGEPQKAGCRPSEVTDLIDRCRDLGLAVDGVLAMGPTGDTPAAARPGFELARRLVDEHGLTVCSVGMTADLEVAVAAGSTQVRLGTALFGPRPGR